MPKTLRGIYVTRINIKMTHVIDICDKYLILIWRMDDTVTFLICNEKWHTNNMAFNAPHTTSQSVILFVCKTTFKNFWHIKSDTLMTYYEDITHNRMRRFSPPNWWKNRRNYWNLRKICDQNLTHWWHSHKKAFFHVWT